MKLIKEHFIAIQAVLTAKSKLPKVINHKASIGQLREQFLKEFLKPNLPDTIKVLSGEIIDSYGNRSGQIDCMLVDSTFPLVHIGSSSYFLVLAEAVLATIEIKSNLNDSELISAMQASAKIKRLIRRGRQIYQKGGLSFQLETPPPIITFIFAYDGLELNTLLKHLERFANGAIDNNVYPTDRITDCICVLGKGLLSRDLLRPKIKEDGIYLHKTKDQEMRSIHLKQDILFAFYQRLLEEVFPLKIDQIDLDPYFGTDDLH